MTTITRTLTRGVDAATRARRALDELEAAIPEPVKEDLELLVSEVVTNAVRHAGASHGDLIELSVEVDRGRVRVEVADPGPGFEPAPVIPTMLQESGWGLYLVGQLSDRWGVERDSDRTVVWFEIDLTWG